MNFILTGGIKMRTIEQIRNELKKLSHKQLEELSSKIDVNFHTLISIRYATRKRNCYQIVQKLNVWLDSLEQKDQA